MDTLKQAKRFGMGFWNEEEGQTLVEYGLLISLIALVVIGVLTIMGRRISTTFNKAANSLAT